MAKSTLAISFYGSFIYIFENRSVRIYAPQCDGHLASVQTDMEEKALDGRTPDSSDTYEYTLIEANSKNPVIGTSKTGCHNGRNILLVDTTRRKAPKPTLKDCYFQIEVPRPNYVIGLIPDPISYFEYDQPDPGKGKTCLRAIAHRFHYDEIDDKRIFQVVRTGKPKATIVEIPMKPFKGENLVQATFRYRSDGMFQENHRDADECFQQMRNLFPPLGAWRVSFDPKSLLEKHGSDCRAAQIVFLTKSEMDQWQAKSEPEIEWHGVAIT
jgi:hypothetical protein